MLNLGHKAVTKVGHGKGGGVYGVYLNIRVGKEVLPGCEFLFSV